MHWRSKGAGKRGALHVCNGLFHCRYYTKFCGSTSEMMTRQQVLLRPLPTALPSLLHAAVLHFEYLTPNPKAPTMHPLTCCSLPSRSSALCTLRGEGGGEGGRGGIVCVLLHFLESCVTCVSPAQTAT
jgi:hypothetical protein